MEQLHPLKALLQLQLASDTYAAVHLHNVLHSLTPDCFLPSTHLQKWTTRINSLLYSKDPAGRWAGLCIAHRTAILSKSTMMECAQGWLAVALPMLSKNEPIPTVKASVRLLRHILTAATDIPEFQRQLATPNVPKVTQALIALAEKEDTKLKLLILNTLSRLVPVYPTLHKALHAALSGLCLRSLNGTENRPTGDSLLEASSRLYASLHFTGGKVGATNLWKKSVDETLAFSWSSFQSLTSTVHYEGRKSITSDSPPSPQDPLVAIPLNLDRLRCGITILCDLMRSSASRPVQVPIGSLVKFITALFTCIPEEKVEGHIEPMVRAMEISVIPEIWKLGCDLLSYLSMCAKHHLSSDATRLISYIAYHLEQKLTAQQRLPFLKVLKVILVHSYPLHSSLLPTRLAKAILPFISVVLVTQSEDRNDSDSATNANKSKKGKNRARGYEGDEVFKTSRQVICPMVEDGEVVLAALDAMQLVLRNQHVSPAVHSITSRVLLSILLALPQMVPSSLSPNTALHGRVLGKVQQLTAELGSGTTSVMSQSLGLVVGAITFSGSELTSANVQREVELLLHPRLPPLVRPLPHVESLSLFRAEESQEEIDAREALGLITANPTSSAAQTLRSNEMAPTGDQAMDAPQHSLQASVQQIPKEPPVIAPEQVPSEKSPLAPDRPAQQPAHPIALTLPPSPDPLPSSTIPPLAPVKLPKPSAPALRPPAVTDKNDDDDEEMPAIDLDSDSD